MIRHITGIDCEFSAHGLLTPFILKENDADRYLIRINEPAKTFEIYLGQTGGLSPTINIE